MKLHASISFSTAILSLAFLSGSIQVQAQTADNSSAAHTLSASMVPAQTQFNQTLEGKKVQAGQDFEVALTQKIKLSDGQELPRGTVLAGKIVANDMANGNSKLSLRFTQAKLKDGKSIPIQAVVTGLYSQGSLNAQYGNNGWTPGQVDVQQSSAAGGLTVHSHVGATDSGTLESKKDSVKVDRGTALFLAVAPGEGSTSTGN